MSSKAMKTNSGLGKMYDVRKYTPPHSAPKRVRKKTIEKEPGYTIHFNGFGVISAAVIAFASPLSVLWKTGLIGLLLLTGFSIHEESK